MVKLLAKTHIDHPFSTFLHFQDNSHLKKSVHVRPSDEQKICFTFLDFLP